MKKSHMSTLMVVAAVAVVAAIALTYYNGSKAASIAGMDVQPQAPAGGVALTTPSASHSGDATSGPGLVGPSVATAAPTATQDPRDLLPTGQAAQFQDELDVLAMDFAMLQGEVQSRGNATHDIRGDLNIPKQDVGPWNNSALEASDRGIRNNGVCSGAN